MRRRICLMGAALSIALLVAVSGSALAAGNGKSKTKKVPTKSVGCSVATTIAIAKGDTAVLPPAAAGDEFGNAACGTLLGSGLQKDTFTVPTSGDTIAKYWMYFKTGSVHGTYDLTPQSSSLNFLSTDWMGTMKVLGGTGAFKGVTGVGTMTCTSADGIHSTCTDHLKLKMPA